MSEIGTSAQKGEPTIPNGSFQGSLCSENQTFCLLRVQSKRKQEHKSKKLADSKCSQTSVLEDVFMLARNTLINPWLRNRGMPHGFGREHITGVVWGRTNLCLAAAAKAVRREYRRHSGTPHVPRQRARRCAQRKTTNHRAVGVVPQDANVHQKPTSKALDG